MVEGCEEHTCIDLGMEDDHHFGIQSIPFERWVKLDMFNFHIFWELAEGRRIWIGSLEKSEGFR